MSQDMVKVTETQVSFRLTNEELERLKAAARSESMSLSSWLRRECLRGVTGASGAAGLPEGMRDELARRAAENYRTPELEALAILAAALGVKGGAE